MAIVDLAKECIAREIARRDELNIEDAREVVAEIQAEINDAINGKGLFKTPEEVLGYYGIDGKLKFIFMSGGKGNDTDQGGTV